MISGRQGQPLVTMLVKSRESCSSHVLSTFPGTPSGSVAFLEFTALSTCLTSCSATVSRGWGAGRWCWSGQRAVVSQSVQRSSLAPLLMTHLSYWMSPHCLCGWSVCPAIPAVGGYLRGGSLSSTCSLLLHSLDPSSDQPQLHCTER